MALRKIAVQGSTELRNANGNVVGFTDKVYSPENSRLVFDEIVVKGDLSGELNYNGDRITVVKVHTVIGLELSLTGPRGPIWKGVECEVLT